jgi:hypothetical protein
VKLAHKKSALRLSSSSRAYLVGALDNYHGKNACKFDGFFS